MAGTNQLQARSNRQVASGEQPRWAYSPEVPSDAAWTNAAVYSYLPLITLGGQTFNVAIDDVTETITDSTTVQAFKLFNVSVGTDTLTVTDAVAAGREIGVSLSDTLSITDAVVRNGDMGRVVSDTAAVTDALLREGAWDRSFADALSVADALAAGLDIAVNLSTDTLTVTDSVARNAEFGRVVSDTAIVTDGLSPEAVYDRSVSDTALGISDLLTPATVYDRSAGTDTLTVTDAVQKEPTLGRSANDTATVTDTTGTNLVYERSASDTLGISDTVTVQTFKLFAFVIDDSLTVTDAVAKYLDLRATPEPFDELAITESLLVEKFGPGVQYDVSLSDSATVTDSATSSLFAERGAADVAGVGDTVAIQSDYSRVCADSVGITDNTEVVLFAANETNRFIGDVLTIEDGATCEMAYAVGISDTVVASDVVDYTRNFAVVQLSFLRMEVP